jgi:PPM family protein phosphatase
MALVRTEPNLIIAQATHEGMSGKENEDNLGAFCWQANGGRRLHVGVVADGIGGQVAGELASRLAVEAVGDYFDRLPALAEALTDNLVEAVLAANQAVYSEGQNNRDLQGMGTTMVIVGVMDGRLYTAYVGDSRIYLLRDGRLRQITVDHTWAQEAIEAGVLTREQAKTHPNRNVIKRFLGGYTEVDVDRRLAMDQTQSRAEMLAGQGLRLRAGDTVLLCSDGLSDMINDDAIHDSLYNHYNNLDKAAAELVDKANAAGGKDNISMVIMQVPGGKPVPPVRAAAAMATPAPAAAATSRPPAPTTPAPLAATPAPAPATPAPAAAPSSFSWGLPLILLGGGGLLVLGLLIGAGIFFLFGMDNGRQDGRPNGEEPTTNPGQTTPDSQQSTPTEGPPATAPIIVFTAEPTANGVPTLEATPTFDADEPTPALIPTLQPTFTHTPTPRPTQTPTATPLPTDTPTPTHTPSPTIPPIPDP